MGILEGYGETCKRDRRMGAEITGVTIKYIGVGFNNDKHWREKYRKDWVRRFGFREIKWKLNKIKWGMN